MQEPNRNFQKAMTAAYTLLGAILALGGLGYYLFMQYDNILWFIGLLLFGMIIGMYELYKQIK